jgi:signal transduction histidine kinase
MSDQEKFFSRLLIGLFILAFLGVTYSCYVIGRSGLLPAFYGVLFISLIGLWVWIKDPGQRVNGSFCLFSLLVAAWACSLLLFEIGGGMGWARVTYLFSSFIPASFFGFTKIFPREEGGLNIRLSALYLLAVIFGALSFTDLIIKSPVSLTWGVTLELGPLYFLFALYFPTVIGFSFANLILKFRKASRLIRTQIMYVFVGSLLSGVMGVSVAIVLPFLGFSRLYPLAPPSVLFMVAFIAYAITKARLMNISVVISRALAEVIAVLLLGALYLLLVWFYRTFSSTRIDPPFIAWTILYGILVGQVHQRLRLFVQTTSDKLFLRGEYDYYRELSAASARVGEKLSLSSILRILYETFYQVVEISNPRIFLPEYFTEPEKESSRYLVFSRNAAFPAEAGEEISFDDPLVKQLISTRRPVLDPHDPKRELVVPCLLEDRLIAIFVLGRKLSEDPYTDDDLHLLEVLASQAAITLDHSRSYEKIKADLEATERQLARSQRLASLGTLTAGVAHEIRNPLTVIRAETERLASKAHGLNYVQQHCDLVLKHTDRIAGITQRMLNLVQQKPKQITEVDLNELIESTLQLFAISRISLKKELRPVPRIKGDPIDLQEVFVNLIQNAIEAMPKEGTLTLRTYTENGRAAAEVSDTGKGIPEEIREKIFDPFFSTRHEGVGLGLSIVYRIIRDHRGEIKVTSEEGKGTAFKILF